MTFKNEHPEHRIETHDGWSKPPYAACSCGWSEETHTRSEAETAASRHYVETTRETAVPIGQFAARCRLTRPVPYDNLAEEQREYVEAEKVTAYRDRKLGQVVDIPCGVTTTDPGVLKQHLTDVHDDPWRWDDPYLDPGVPRECRTYRSRTSVYSKPWMPPKLHPEGKPFKASTKAIGDTIRTCSACRLIAEVTGDAGERWWDEHVESCTGPEVGAA